MVASTTIGLTILRRQADSRMESPLLSIKHCNEEYAASVKLTKGMNAVPQFFTSSNVCPSNFKSTDATFGEVTWKAGL